MRSNTSGSTSKKSTPGWNKRYPKKNDSNIVTSPVKTIRHFGNESSDEYDTTTTYDNNNKQDSTTMNVPLKSSPKKPLRKGTPKAPKTKQTTKSPKKDTPASKVQNHASQHYDKSDNSLDHDDKSKTRIVTNSHITHQVSTHENDDDDLLSEDHNSENTLLSNIPDDILSPEKHIYPPENLRRSSSNSLKTKDTTNLFANPFPAFSPPKQTSINDEAGKSQATRKSPSNVSEKHERSARFLSKRAPDKAVSLPPAESIDGGVGEEHENTVSREVSHDVTSLKTVQRARESIAIRRREESEAISIFFDKTSSPRRSQLSVRPSSESPRSRKTQELRGASPRTVPNLFPDMSYDKNSSFNQLNEFIKNPLIDRNKYKSTSETSKESRVEKEHNPQEPTNHRQSSHGLELSQFESSDEEPVPELTVPLNDDLEPKNQTKRVYDEPIETSTNKKPRQSLYPTIAQQSPAKRSSESKESRSLYPTLPSMGHPARVSSEMIDDISDNIPNVESSNSAHLRVHPVGHSRTKPQEPQLLPNPLGEIEKEQLGDPDHWIKNQWSTFFKAFKRFKKTNNLSIFSDRLLEYLRCDENEIKLKIQFALDYEDEIRKKKKT